jgi:hypothetical protein
MAVVQPSSHAAIASALLSGRSELVNWGRTERTHGQSMPMSDNQL